MHAIIRTTSGKVISKTDFPNLSRLLSDSLYPEAIALRLDYLYTIK